MVILFDGYIVSWFHGFMGFMVGALARETVQLSVPVTGYHSNVGQPRGLRTSYITPGPPLDPYIVHSPGNLCPTLDGYPRRSKLS